MGSLEEASIGSLHRVDMGCSKTTPDNLQQHDKICMYMSFYIIVYYLILFDMIPCLA